MAYTIDLTEAEFKIIEPLLPRKKRTNPPKWTNHQILNGLFYQLKNGCNWADLPKDLPHTQQCIGIINNGEKAAHLRR
jgi:transposase